MDRPCRQNRPGPRPSERFRHSERKSGGRSACAVLRSRRKTPRNLAFFGAADIGGDGFEGGRLEQGKEPGSNLRWGSGDFQVVSDQKKNTAISIRWNSRVSERNPTMFIGAPTLGHDSDSLSVCCPGSRGNASRWSQSHFSAPIRGKFQRRITPGSKSDGLSAESEASHPAIIAPAILARPPWPPRPLPCARNRSPRRNLAVHPRWKRIRSSRR